MAARRRMKTVAPPIMGQRHTGTRSRGLVDIRTLARRVLALDRLPWDRVEVIYGRVEDVQPVAGATVYFDPPYAHSPRYALLIPREIVLETALRWESAGARVAISEGEPLPLHGWTSWRLDASKPEFITAIGLERPARAVQEGLFDERRSA